MFFKRSSSGAIFAISLVFASWVMAPCVVSAQVDGATTETLGIAHIPGAVRDRIYRELASEFEAEGGLERSVLDGFEVKMIRLGPDGRKGLEVWPGREGAVSVCGATGNCSIWVFDRGTGNLLLSANGWELRAETTVHNGHYDFVTRHNMSADSGIRDWYRFDGHAYKQVRETEY
jgi:hypothetical protein